MRDLPHRTCRRFPILAVKIIDFSKKFSYFLENSHHPGAGLTEILQHSEFSHAAEIRVDPASGASLAASQHPVDLIRRSRPSSFLLNSREFIPVLLGDQHLWAARSWRPDGSDCACLVRIIWRRQQHWLHPDVRWCLAYVCTSH